MLITFSGLDGAGKSTLIKWLNAELQRDGCRVTVLHINTHVGLYAYARFLRDRLFARFIRRGGGGTASITAPHAALALEHHTARRGLLARIRTAILWSKSLRELIYLVDLALFLVYRAYIEMLRGRVLIMDRYFYDSLVDVATGRNDRMLRVLQRLTPTPDVAFLVAVPPEQAYGRKREQPFSYLERRWKGYQTVFPWISTAVILENHSLGATKTLLHRVVTERLARHRAVPERLPQQ